MKPKKRSWVMWAMVDKKNKVVKVWDCNDYTGVAVYLVAKRYKLKVKKVRVTEI